MGIGVVTLRVRDLEGVGDYYRRVIGLETLEAAGGRTLLGAGDAPLLEVLGDSALRARDPRGAGLFHTAFLMPSRGDLASWLRRAVVERVRISGASDHAVSEAIYLSDPEGNGVEVYADRPRSAWSYVDGAISMGSSPLDVEGLLRADPERRWNGAPRGLVVGHIHLQVGAIPPADAFHAELLGFDITCRYPDASFFGAGGYHHQVAANIWNSRDAGQIDRTRAGLERFEILARDAATLASIAVRAESAGLRREPAADGFALRDPWGLTIQLKAR
jgi:catechol 2,3-dioxygenase